MLFADRKDAGQRLAKALLHVKGQKPVVLALTRGGVPVGFEIAMSLAAPLDVVLVRKLGSPWSPELAIGAIAEGEPVEQVSDATMMKELNIPEAYLDKEIARQSREIERRRQLYLKIRPALDIKQCTAIVVDDGIATGATMRAALRAVRRRAPARLILAAPVAPPDALASLRPEVDEIVCLATPVSFGGISEFYADFRQIDDEVVIDMLKRNAEMIAKAKAAPPASG